MEMSVIDTFLNSLMFDALLKMKKNRILEIRLKLELDARQSM